VKSKKIEQLSEKNIGGNTRDNTKNLKNRTKVADYDSKSQETQSECFLSAEIS
jgi:hypothetical protein